MAEEGGYFAGNGLEVEVIATEGGGPDFQAMLSGEVEFNFSTTTAPISAYLAGQDVTVVMAGNTQPAVDVVISADAMADAGVAANSPLADRVKALEGLQVGVSRPGTFFDHLLHYIIESYDVKDVDVVATGGGATALTALTQGQVDALVYSPPVVQQAVESRAGVWLLRPSEGEIPELDGLIQSSLNVRSDFVAANRDIVTAMVTALHDAGAWISTAEVGDIADLLSKEFEQMDPAVLRSSVETMKNVVSPTGCITQDGIDVVVRLLEVGGGAEPGTQVPLSDIATNEFVPGGCA